jgi:hypothetical protein
LIFEQGMASCLQKAGVAAAENGKYYCLTVT